MAGSANGGRVAGAESQEMQSVSANRERGRTIWPSYLGRDARAGWLSIRGFGRNTNATAPFVYSAISTITILESPCFACSITAAASF